ncbi:MAG: DUF4397 domain-containing protein [Ignavibacterium sp.]|nr:DUF4397 domain-containing protein [Ignavibacterium sp.]
MRIPHKSKLLLALSICTVVFIAGCVDTSVQSLPTSIDYSSQIKVVNLVSGAGTATLTLNGQSLGTAEFGGEAPSQATFLTIPSGSKVLNASFASTTENYQFAAATDYKLRVFLVGTAAVNEIVVGYQRYIWQTPGSVNGNALFPADTGQVAFFNGSPDAVLNSVTISGTTDTSTVEFDSPLGMGESASYMKLKAGSYSFDVLYNDSLHTTFNYDLSAKGRYTAAIYDVAASIKNAVFVDD